MKLGNEFKRVLTGVMTAAMIFTSVPAAPVMAAAPADVLVESDDLQDISLEDGSEVLAESAEETLSEAPVAEEVLAEDVTEEADLVDVTPASEVVAEGEGEELSFEVKNPEEKSFGEVFGNKKPSDIQGTLTITDAAEGEEYGKITGTLKRVVNWEKFSSDPTLRSGHYISISVDGVEGATEVVAELENGDGNPANLTEDPDKTAILRIRNKDTQKLVVTVKKNEKETIKKYDLSGLVLEEFGVNNAISTIGPKYGDDNSGIEDIDITNTAISGKLNYVTGYKSFSAYPSEQSGHYLMLGTPFYAKTTLKWGAVSSLSDNRNLHKKYANETDSDLNDDGIVWMMNRPNDLPCDNKYFKLTQIYVDGSEESRFYDISELALEGGPVQAEEQGKGVLGKQVSELQTAETIVSDNKIIGKLFYVEGYTGFSSDKSLQSGYYLALHVNIDEIYGIEGDDKAKITMAIVPSSIAMDPVEIQNDPDHNIVFKVTDPKTQKIVVKKDYEKKWDVPEGYESSHSKVWDDVTYEYSLEDLELETVETGTLNFVTKGDSRLIKDVQYKFDEDSEFTTSSNITDPVGFANKRKVEVKADGAENVSNDVYTLSVNGKAASTGDVITFDGSETYDIPVSAIVKDDYKSGTLNIATTSSNVITKVCYKFDSTNVTYDEETRTFAAATSASENGINNDNAVVCDYTFAKKVNIWIDSNDTSDKYVYVINGEQYAKSACNSESNSIAIDLKDNTTPVTIAVKQVKFDATVNTTIVSSDKIKAFDYEFDVDSEPTTYNISQNAVKFSAKEAKKITFSNFVGSDDVEAGSYYLVVTADGKEVESDDSGNYEIPIEGTSVNVTIKAVPKVKVTVSFNGVKNKFSISGMTAIVEGEESPVGLESKFGDKEYASFYVKNGKTVSVDKVGGKEGYNFAKMAGVEISEDGTKWELGAITEDKLFTIDKVQYALSQNIVISDGHNYPISVSLDEISGAVTDVADSKLFTKNSNDLNVTVKTVYDKEKDNNYYELPEKDSKYSLKYVLRSGSAVDVMATRNSSDLGKYTVTIPANAIIELFEAGKVLSLKTELQKYVHNYELTFTSNPEGSATAEGYVNGKEVIALTGSGNVKKDIAYGSKVGITAKAAPGYVLKSVSINVAPHGTVTQNQVTVIKSTDKEFAAFSSASGYQLTLEADTEVKFESEKEYATAVKYTKDSKEPEKDNKGVYQVINNKEVTVEYKYGTETPSYFDYSLLLDKKTVSNSAAEVKDYVKKTSTGLTIDGKGLQGKTLAVTLFATDVSGNKVEKSDKALTFKIDSDKTKSVKFAKTAETVAIGGKTTLDLKVKGTFEYSLSVSGDAVKPNAYFAYNDGKYDYTKVIVYAGTAVSPDKEYTINVTDDNNSGAVLASIKVTTKNVVKDAKAPVASVVNTTNNALYLSLKANKLDTTLDGLEYKIEYTISNVKTDTPFKANGTYTETVAIDKTSCIIDLLKEGATEAQKLDGDPDAKITIKVSIVQKNGATEIASTQVTELKDQSTKPGGKFATKINIKKAKGTVSKLYTSMDGSDAANKMVLDVDFGKDTSIQLLDMTQTTFVDADGNVVNAANWSYNQATMQFEIIPNAEAQRMKAGDYVLTAAALEPSSVPVTKSMKIKVVQGIEKLELQGNTKIYKLAGTKTTASVTAFDMSGAMKETKKVTWSLEGTTDNAKTAIANKDITINGSGKISIKKNFVAKNVSFNVKATAKDFKGSKVTDSITVNVLTEASKAYELAFSNDLGGNWATLPATADVVDFFGNLGPAPDNKNYKYITYVQLRETEGTMANIPASFKVSGAKLLGTYKNDANETYAMIGFTKPGNVKIQATAVDGSGRAFSGKTAKVVAVNGSKGQVGYTITDAKGTTIATNIAKSVATEENKSVSYNIAQGDSITLNLTGYSDKKANFINNKVSVKGGKLIKYKFYTDVYTIQPNKDVVEIKITNADAKKTFTVTIANGAIAGSKASKTTIKGKSKADAGNGKKIYASLDFSGVLSTDIALGFKGYESDNKITYSVTPASDYVLVSVEKDDTNGAIGDAVAEASKVGGVATKAGGAYKIAVKDGQFAIDFIKADKTFTIKPGTYKLTVTPVDKNNTALGKPATVNVQAIKVPAYKANITKNIDMTKTISTNVITKAGKNFIKDVYFTGVLKKANIKGNLNNFDGNFQMAAGKNEIKFVGKGNKEGTPKAVNDKNEFQGYIEYKYQGLDGVIRTDYVKVTVKAPKTGLTP